MIQTEKKGFGLRADAPLQANDFIFEYIGEVINEPTFRKRMLQYDHQGIKHFYFMSLSKSEFVDATKKGNLGRFCNHSCSPNCYVDKWVVGDKLRMGIFALRTIRAGEELVFNYNVDRYGADPQPCYCGEPHCVGFIGGKTQTERATKLPAATVEALGIDIGDGWDTAVAKKPRKKRADEDDEDYVNSLQPRGLDKEDARKVMASLMQCKEKWIAVKLLERIRGCDDDKVINYVMRMHAYSILKTTLNTFIEDHNVVLQVLDILDSFPRLTRNKIQDSKIEGTVERLVQSENEDIAQRSQQLLGEWTKLEMAFRIKRRKVDPNALKQDTREERRGGASREEEQSRATPSKTASPQVIDAPKGPRNSAPQRSNAFQPIVRQRRPFNAPLPEGWFAAKDAGGNTYFYDKQGTTTWARPFKPAIELAPKGPSKALQEQALIQSIINKVTKEGTMKTTTPPLVLGEDVKSPVSESRKDKWRSLPLDKQMKIYENTVSFEVPHGMLVYRVTLANELQIFPPIKHVLDKFRNKLPKDDLKRLGKDIAKKLVASDYKNNRVGNPTAKLSEKQVGKVKKYVKEFLDRAVEKYSAHQQKKTAKNAAAPEKNSMGNGDTVVTSADVTPGGGDADELDDDIELALSDVEQSNLKDGSERKRKHDDVTDSEAATPSEAPDSKRLRDDEETEPSPPPPPPPPPKDTVNGVEVAGDEELSEREQVEREALRQQEEALERENEEAQRLQDENMGSMDMGNVDDPHHIMAAMAPSVNV